MFNIGNHVLDVSDPKHPIRWAPIGCDPSKSDRIHVRIEPENPPPARPGKDFRPGLHAYRCSSTGVSTRSRVFPYDV